MPKFISRTEVHFQQNVGGNGKTHENKTWASLWDNLGHLKAIAKGPTKVQEEGGVPGPNWKPSDKAFPHCATSHSRVWAAVKGIAWETPEEATNGGEREYLELIFHFCFEEWLVKDTHIFFSTIFYINSYTITVQITQVQWKLYRYLIYPVVSHSLTTKTSPN